MRNITRITLLVLIVLFLAVAPVAAQREDHPLISIDICRIAGSNDYSATFSNIGMAPLHVGYILQTTENNVPVDVGYLEPKGPSITVRVPLEPDVVAGFSLMVWRDSEWHYGLWYRLLDGSLNYGLCSSADLPAEAPPAAALDCGNGNELALVHFDNDTPLYYLANPDAQTDYKIPAGSTAWLTTNTADFSAVRWACMTLWVPIGDVTTIQ